MQSFIIENTDREVEMSKKADTKFTWLTNVLDIPEKSTDCCSCASLAVGPETESARLPFWKNNRKNYTKNTMKHQ